MTLMALATPFVCRPCAIIFEPLGPSTINDGAIVVLTLPNEILNLFSLRNTVYSLHGHRISPGSR